MELKLQAEKRVRNEKLPADSLAAVLYGKGVTNQSLKIKRLAFEKVFAAAGESNLIDLDYGDGGAKVLVKDVQHDVLKHVPTHVDFYQVNMKEKITTEIPLHFNGEAKAVRELGGMLMKEVHGIEVECLPGDLVDHIEVDISSLNTFDDVIRISDLALPKGFRLLHNNPEDVVAMVVEPKAEEPAPAAEAAPAEAAAAAPAEKKEEEKK